MSETLPSDCPLDDDSGSRYLHGSDCDDFETLLQDCLDARQSPSEIPQLIEHAKECAHCQEAMNDFVWLNNSLTLAYPQSQSRRADSEFRPTVRNQNMSWKIVLGTLAASILAIAAFDSLGQTRSHSVALNSPKVSVGAPNVPPSPGPTEPSRLASRPPKSGSEISVSLTTCYELTSELPGIRPIRSSVDATWNYLQRIIPAINLNPSPKDPGDPGVGQNLEFSNRYATV